MVGAGVALSGCKQAASEFSAVVSQQFLDSDRTGFVQGVEKRVRTGRCLVGLDGYEPRLVTLEDLVGLLGRGGFESIQVVHALAVQAPAQPRARHIGAQNFARHGQRIFERR